jgi:hypothetical protein
LANQTLLFTNSKIFYKSNKNIKLSLKQVNFLKTSANFFILINANVCCYLNFHIINYNDFKKKYVGIFNQHIKFVRNHTINVHN